MKRNFVFVIKKEEEKKKRRSIPWRRSVLYV